MKVLIAGDFCPQNRVAKKFEQGDFDSVLSEVKAIISAADYAIVNFECPVTKGGETPIAKQGPNLQCSEEGMEAVKWTGFDCVTLANNHFLDFGKDGAEHTLEVCEKYGIDIVGGGMNLQEASKTLYKGIDGRTLAVINCCEHEFSIATEQTAGSNPLNPIQQYYAIQKAKQQADYILVIVHGGHEHYQLPSLRMQETYRFFIDAGADAVVNHHQHCISGYEVYQGKPIFYGIGNFCFDKPGKRGDLWNEGYMVQLNFDDAKIGYEIFPYTQCDKDSKLTALPGDSFDGCVSELNEIIKAPQRLTAAADEYYNKCSSGIGLLYEPIRNKHVLAAQKRGWLPSFVTRKHLVKISNYTICESHRDKVIYYLLHRQQTR